MDYIPETITLTVTLPTDDYMVIRSDDTTGTMDWTNGHDNQKFRLDDSSLTRYGWGYGGWGLGNWGAGWTNISATTNVALPGLWTFAVVAYDIAGNVGSNGETAETYQTPQPKKPGKWGTDAASYANNILTLDL